MSLPGRSDLSPHLFERTAPQLAKLVDLPPSQAGWVHEVKFDGYRVQLQILKGKSLMRTRTGLDWSDRFAALAAAAKSLPDCILDGEVVALDLRGLPNFSATH